MGERLSIDEVALSKGELYTILSNKSAKGRKGSIVACISSTKSEDIIKVLQKLPLDKRKQVKEITLDMANNMESSVKMTFPNAQLVTDRFHVVRLVIEALQSVRIKHRWAALEEQNKKIKEAREKKIKYESEKLSNGDTVSQLLARSRYSLFKFEETWTLTQKERAELLFEKYPEIELAYYHTIRLRKIYNITDKIRAIKALRDWIEDTRKLTINNFNSTANTIENNFQNILNFFDNRSTNANAESFNAKIKLFRANQRGVNDTKFFLFRLAKIYA